MDKLKPCPFCGSTNIMRQSIRGTIQNPPYWWMRCEDCSANGPWVEDANSPEVAWNNRPAEIKLRNMVNEAIQAASALLEALMEARNG